MKKILVSAVIAAVLMSCGNQQQKVAEVALDKMEEQVDLYEVQFRNAHDRIDSGIIYNELVSKLEEINKTYAKGMSEINNNTELKQRFDKLQQRILKYSK